MNPVPVLIVDDQAPFLDALRSLFGRMKDFRLVGEARSGEEAVALADDLHPELVMMDISMDGIGGIKATEMITAHDRKVLVVLVSTYPPEDLPPCARTCGAAAYIGKGDLSVGAVRRLWIDRGDPGW